MSDEQGIELTPDECENLLNLLTKAKVEGNYVRMILHDDEQDRVLSFYAEDTRKEVRLSYPAPDVRKLG